MNIRAIVIFYSLEGSTRLLGHSMAYELGASVLEIKPEEEISPKGFMRYLWGGRQVVMGLTPPLMPFTEDIGSYDLIIIGTPVWAFNFSPPLRTLLAQYPVKGKNVALYCTHEGAPGKTLENMAALLEGNTIVGKKAFANVAKEKEAAVKAAQEWVKEIKDIHENKGADEQA